MMRERTYTWEDPMILPTAAAGLSGLDFLRRIGRGDLPIPAAGATAGIEPIDVGEGWAHFALIPQEWHTNGLGSVHGGILSTLADTALGCAVHTKLAAGTGYTSVDLVMKFLRPATTASGPLECRATVTSMGRRTATSECQIVDHDERVIAVGISTCLLMPLHDR